MQRIGVIGVGNIGSRFARVLCEDERAVTVHDIDASKMEAAVALGAAAAKTPGEVAKRAEMVLLCLPGSPAVVEVMEGGDGLLAHLRPGQLVVDTGTTHPDTDARYAKECEARGAALIDAPITGRSQGFIMMVGGAREEFEKAREVLALLSYKVAHIGPIGRGQLLKLMNQMVLAGQWAVWAEAIEWGEKSGVDGKLLRDYLEFPVAEGLYGDEFAGGGTLGLHYKDLGYVLDLAHENGAAIPVTNAVHEAFKAAKEWGEADWSQPGIVTYWRRLGGSR